MTDTPISIVQRAKNLGLKLGLKQPDTLTVESAKPWPKEAQTSVARTLYELVAKDCEGRNGGEES